MMFRIVALFIAVFWTINVFAGVGSVDGRQMVETEEWCRDFPYIVRFHDSGYACTAQYVAKNIILTAAHCVRHGENTGIRNCKGSFYKVKLHSKSDFNKVGDVDWALYVVEDEMGYLDSEKSIPSVGGGFASDGITTVTNLGFGFVRVLDNEDLAIIRSVIEADNYETGKLSEAINDALEADGRMPFNGDGNNLKKHVGCKVLSLDKAEKCDFIVDPDYCEGHYFYVAEEDKEKKFMKSTCDTWSGNSGGGFFNDGHVLGVVSSGEAASASSFRQRGSSVTLTSSEAFVDAYNDLVNLLTPTASNVMPVPSDDSRSDLTSGEKTETGDIVVADADVVSSTDGPVVVGADVAPSTDVPVVADADVVSSTDGPKEQEDVTKIEADISSQEGELYVWLEGVNVQNMTVEQVFVLLNWLAEIEALKERVKAAKEREQSKPNKILGAAAIGATGIGGMQLASALAEQNADEDAEEAMRAYLATFHCNYAPGKNIAGGAKDVELPGGNELIDLLGKYVNLANDLKLRKTALDMKPGIESEPILDTAITGLYDDISVGKISGAYASLARALLDPKGEDAKRWAKQKSDTKTKLITGASIAGVGAVGGLVGDLIINKDEKKSKDKSDYLNEYKEKYSHLLEGKK